MKIMLFILLSLFSKLHAQHVTIKEMRLEQKAAANMPGNASINYPIVQTKYPAIDRVINEQILTGILGENNDHLSLKKLLLQQIKEGGLIDLSYEITYNRRGILSLSIYLEGCGAYCSSWNTYFNFDLATGKKINISDLITNGKVESFGELVSAEKMKAIILYKTEEKELLQQNFIDSISYNWALEQVDSNCSIKASIETFSLTNYGLKIVDDCEFPHAIRALQPIYNFHYGYKIMEPFLKPKYQKLLFKSNEKVKN